MKIICILFDLDGTLIHSLPDIVAHINRLRADYQLPYLSESVVSSFIGKGAQHLLAGCFKDAAGLNPKELVEKFRNYYLEKPRVTGHVYPGVHETLKYLKSLDTVSLGIITNKPTDVARKTLAQYLPEISFNVILGPEMVTRCKPHPEHIMSALRFLKVQAAHTWLIGDDPVDLECAKAAGVHFLAAKYGFGGVANESSSDETLYRFADILNKIPLE